MILLRLGRLLAIALLTTGGAVHFSSRDAWQPLAALFYALPLPVLAIGWFVVAVSWGKVGRCCLLCLVPALGSGAWWLALTYREPGVATQAAPGLKVLFWNLAHRKLPSEDLEELLAARRPDIAAFVETGARHGDPSPLTYTLPPGCTELQMNHAMRLVVRGSAKVVRQELLPGATKFAEVQAVVGDVLWRVFIVDGASFPTTPRGPALSHILEMSRGHLRTLVLGDFNTPIESRHFVAWDLAFHHAEKEAGSGLRETWPRWLPVLTIDHVWSSPDAPPLRAEKLWFKTSDHAALWTELGVSRALR
ncbi:MAG: endonuclease/exonuclease/phosphatase family protein [Roseimicrobium sp.]